MEHKKIEHEGDKMPVHDDKWFVNFNRQTLILKLWNYSACEYRWTWTTLTVDWCSCNPTGPSVIESKKAASTGVARIFTAWVQCTHPIGCSFTVRFEMLTAIWEKLDKILGRGLAHFTKFFFLSENDTFWCKMFLTKQSRTRKLGEFAWYSSRRGCTWTPLDTPRPTVTVTVFQAWEPVYIGFPVTGSEIRYKKSTSIWGGNDGVVSVFAKKRWEFENDF